MDASRREKDRLVPADSPLSRFAAGHGLGFAERVDLPKQGNLLSRDGTFEGTAS
jgi:hypothetical protein